MSAERGTGHVRFRAAWLVDAPSLAPLATAGARHRSWLEVAWRYSGGLI